MLNKKKVVAFIAIIIVIILAITAVFVVKNKRSKIAKIYDELVKSDEYVVEMKNSSNYEIMIAKKGNETYIDMNSGDGRVTTLIKEDIAYVISHEQRQYQAFDKATVGDIAIADLLGNVEDKKFSKGKEKIEGKTYKYEEYKEFSSFTLSDELEDSETSTRFYFDGNDLVYIKTMQENEDAELLEVKISYSAQDELFEIPSDYVKIDDLGF